MKKGLLSIFTIFFIHQMSYADTLIIDQQGLYNIGQDIDETGTDIVEIAVSDVVLDLQENTLSGGLNGIVIDPNLSNITIRNGRLFSLLENGIQIGANCRNIQLFDLEIFQTGTNAVRFETDCSGIFLDGLIINGITKSAISIAENNQNFSAKNLYISNCNGSAIEVLGTSTASQVCDIIFKEISIDSCVLSDTFTQIIRIDYGLNIVLENTTIRNSGNSTGPLTMIELNECVNCGGTDILGITSTAVSLIGVSFVHSESNVFRGVNIIGNEAMTDDLNGFLLTQTSVSNIFSMCSVVTNTAMNGTCLGWRLEALSDRNIFRDCDVATLVGADAIGFDLSSSDTMFFNIFQDCEVVQCVALTGSVIGFNIDKSSQGTLFECVASYNRAPNGAATGLLFKSGTGGDRWSVQLCRFVRNLGLNDANSFGVNVASGNDNAFVQNYAFSNGDTPGNQLLGVPAGSQTQLNPGNLNSTNSPWGNIAVTI